jgi:hypothetical protein
MALPLTPAQDAPDKAEDVATEKGSECEESHSIPSQLTHVLTFQIITVTNVTTGSTAVVSPELVTEHAHDANLCEHKEPEVHFVAEVHLA